LRNEAMTPHERFERQNNRLADGEHRHTPLTAKQPTPKHKRTKQLR
jgi:hypothetical protein